MDDELLDREWFIYALIDPRTEDVRYIGWSYDPRKRLVAHLWESRKRASHKHNWIAALMREGLIPICQIIDQGWGDGWGDAEKRWIAYYREAGARLTNGSAGGEGFPKSEDIKEKIRRTSLGRKHSPAAIERIRQNALNASDETRLKRSIALRGKRHSAEIRARYSRAARARGVAPSTMEAIAAANVARQKSVRRIEDGAMFSSLADAARAMGVSYVAIRRSIRNGWRCCGYRWEFVGKS